MIPHTFELYGNALTQGTDTEPRGFISLFFYGINSLIKLMWNVIFSSAVFPRCSLTQFLTPRVPVTQKKRKSLLALCLSPTWRTFLKRLDIVTEVSSNRPKKVGAFHIRVETDPLSKTLWSLEIQMMDKIQKLSNMEYFQDYHTTSISKVILFFIYIYKFPLPKVILPQSVLLFSSCIHFW